MPRLGIMYTWSGHVGVVINVSLLPSPEKGVEREGVLERVAYFRGEMGALIEDLQ